MDIYEALESLLAYALDKGLIGPCDRVYMRNSLLDVLGLAAAEPANTMDAPLEDILAVLTNHAVKKGLVSDDRMSRDLFDTRIMGLLTPLPREVRSRFADLYADKPEKATDWYYAFSQDTDYIRRYRIKNDVRWSVPTEYGPLEVSINLSKPEKDPKAIALAKAAPQAGYPKCQLCVENEGYAGRVNHPARQNHRVIPVTLAGEEWFWQYSPYVYYNEHCIVFNRDHVPMQIDGSTFQKLLDFVTLFPHYFVGSNADLPIVGGSILSHEHFQGGRHSFPMQKAGEEFPVAFKGFDNVCAAVVKWPMSVIRLESEDKPALIKLAEIILSAWRSYTDEEAFVFAETEGEPHNTITPIASANGETYRLDLVLRNNVTTEEHPLGVFHPHAELHHIKKENIGLIEVMGLAVLPSRLKRELAELEEALVTGRAIAGEAEKHAEWAESLREKYVFRKETAHDILLHEVGLVFRMVLEHAGVFKRTDEGRAAFRRFLAAVNARL